MGNTREKVSTVKHNPLESLPNKSNSESTLIRVKKFCFPQSYQHCRLPDTLTVACRRAPVMMATKQDHTPQTKGNETIIEGRREYSSEELSNQQDCDIA